MRAVATLAGIALTAVPALAASKGTLGFALGTKLADGSCKYTSDYEADFDAIQSNTGSTIVRGYAASDCNCAQQILPAAKSKGFKVILGVWYDIVAYTHVASLALTLHSTGRTPTTPSTPTSSRSPLTPRSTPTKSMQLQSAPRRSTVVTSPAQSSSRRSRMSRPSYPIR